MPHMNTHNTQVLHTFSALFLPFDVKHLSLTPTADTPIEEFTPTPAFPALQYLESVDEGGVAWQAGLRTGDFLIEVREAPPRPLQPLGQRGGGGGGI